MGEPHQFSIYEYLDPVIISNIVLIGMPGTFKTSAGKKLADSLGMNFIDTDDFVEFEYCITIDECFKVYGEPHFRDLEAKIINRVSGFENTVISTGGGAVMRDDNMERLKRHGVIVLVTCDLNVLYRRVKDSKGRPLLKGLFKKRSLKRLYRSRHDMYMKYADIVVDNTHLSSGETAEMIERKIAEFYK